MAISLGVLGATAAVQAVIFVLTGSVALRRLDPQRRHSPLTAIPVGAAFLLRSERAEKWAGYAVVLAIFVSACVAPTKRSSASYTRELRICGRLPEPA